MKRIFDSIVILIIVAGCVSKEEKQATVKRANALMIIDTTLLEIRLKKLDEYYKYYDSVEFYRLLKNDVDKAFEYAIKFNAIVKVKLDSQRSRNPRHTFWVRMKRIINMGDSQLTSGTIQKKPSSVPMPSQR